MLKTGKKKNFTTGLVYAVILCMLQMQAYAAVPKKAELSAGTTLINVAENFDDVDIALLTGKDYQCTGQEAGNLFTMPQTYAHDQWSYVGTKNEKIFGEARKCFATIWLAGDKSGANHVLEYQPDCAVQSGDIITISFDFATNSPYDNIGRYALKLMANSDTSASTFSYNNYANNYAAVTDECIFAYVRDQARIGYGGAGRSDVVFPGKVIPNSWHNIKLVINTSDADKNGAQTLNSYLDGEPFVYAALDYINNNTATPITSINKLQLVSQPAGTALGEEEHKFYWDNFTFKVERPSAAINRTESFKTDFTGFGDYTVGGLKWINNNTIKFRVRDFKTTDNISDGNVDYCGTRTAQYAADYVSGKKADNDTVIAYEFNDKSLQTAGEVSFTRTGLNNYNGSADYSPILTVEEGQLINASFDIAATAPEQQQLFFYFRTDTDESATQTQNLSFRRIYPEEDAGFTTNTSNIFLWTQNANLFGPDNKVFARNVFNEKWANINICINTADSEYDGLQTLTVYIDGIKKAKYIADGNAVTTDVIEPVKRVLLYQMNFTGFKMTDKVPSKVFMDNIMLESTDNYVTGDPVISGTAYNNGTFTTGDVTVSRAVVPYGAAQPVTMIAAYYVGGVMQNCEVVNKIVTNNDKDVTVTLPVNTAGGTLKTMLWNGNFDPLVSPVIK